MISLILPTHKLRLELHVTLSPLSVEIEEFIIIAFEKSINIVVFNEFLCQLFLFNFVHQTFYLRDNYSKNKSNKLITKQTY